MRKIFQLTLIASVLFTVTGCLKDKGFEKQEYGIQIAEVKSVAFPQSLNSPIVVGVDAQSTPQTIDGPTITLEQSGTAPADIKVTLTINTALVTNGGYTPLPVGSIAVTTLNPTITAGEKFTKAVKFTFPNSAALDPNIQYGIGLTISSVDQGYGIAGNKKDILFVFTVKNKYDGNYRMLFRTVGWAAYGISDNLPGTWPSNPDGTSIGMVTGGPNSVRLYDYWGFEDFIQPAFTPNNAAGTGFGATAPRFYFDLATNKLTSVVNDAPDDGRGRAFVINPDPTLANYYDPATKIIYAAYIMKQNGRPDQFIYATLTYLGPRP